MKKLKHLIAVSLMVVCMATGVLAGCSPENPPVVVDPPESADYFHKYSETVHMSVGQWVADATNFPEGESPTDNSLYRMIEKYTNIKMEPKFTVPYGQQFYDTVARFQMSDDLPDVTAMDVTCFHDAVKAGQLADLTEIYEEYASPALKSIFESNNSLFLKLGTVDGKLYGLPAPTSSLDGVPVLWIREDWIDITGFKEGEDVRTPETYEEFEEMLYLFKDKIGQIEEETQVQNCYPMAFYKDFGAPYRAIMNAHGAYPGIYVEENGEIVYGSLTDEVRDTLKIINQYDADGMFRTGWSTLENTEIAANSAAGRVGVFIDSYWGALTTQMQGVIGMKFKGDNPGLANADWIAVPMPAPEGETISPINDVVNSASQNYYVASTKFGNPEAMIILMNYLVEGYGESNEEEQTGYYNPYVVEYRELANSEKYASRSIFNWLPIILDNPDKNATYTRNICEALETNDTSKLVGEEILYYNYITGEATTPEAKLNQWVWNMVYGPDGGVQACLDYGDNLTHDLYLLAPTRTMQLKSSILEKSILNKSVTEMITTYSVGDIDEKFQEMVDDYNSSGGSDILDEVRAALA